MAMLKTNYKEMTKNHMSLFPRFFFSVSSCFSLALGEVGSKAPQKPFQQQK
jgi:hypothetical protein